MNRLKGYARRGDAANNLIRLMEEPDSLFEKEGAVILKDSRTTSSLLFRSEGLGSGIYMKRFNVKGPSYVLKNMFRRSRAKKVWYAANSMSVRQIPTPQPLLYLEQRKFRALFKSYFVTEMIPGAQSLDSCVTAGFVRFTPGQKPALIRSIALHVRLMHERGIFHGDLKANNILVQDQVSGEIKVFFVDLDAVRVADRLSFRHRCRDIARLNCSFLNTAVVSKTHRLYFLKCYLERAGRKDLKTAWDTVMFFTERKLRKSGRSFTPQKKHVVMI